MAPRAPDVVDVRRLYIRFVFLVILPVVGLVSFGVIAIANERAALEARFSEEYAVRLRRLVEHLASRLDDVSAALTRGDTVGAPLVRFAFTLQPGADRVDATGLAPGDTARVLAEAARAARPEEKAVVFFALRSGDARGLYAVTKRAETLAGIAFDDAALSSEVSATALLLFPGEAAAYALEGPQEVVSVVGNPLRRLVDEFSGTPAPALALPAPLGEWRLVVRLPGGDPIRTAVVRNRTVYIVLLALFYVLITLGVIATLRVIVREMRLSRLKTDFVSSISHELRTPLTSIRMFAETLALGRARTEEERRECLEHILRESERLSVLTERTLDWARIEAGRRPYDLKPEPVKPLVDRTVEAFLARSRLEPSRLTVTVAGGLPAVLADAGAIDQVLTNLLENAMKYTGDDRRIDLRVTAAGRRVCVEVSDNGIGIARRDQKRIFERFYRADSLLARATEGTGLGLSIARRIVEAHGGRIRVKSTVGTGSTFTVELRAAPDTPPEKP